MERGLALQDDNILNSNTCAVKTMLMNFDRKDLLIR